MESDNMRIKPHKKAPSKHKKDKTISYFCNKLNLIKHVVF